MRGEGFMDILKSVGSFGSKAVKFLTPAAKAIAKELKPIIKEVGPVVMKEVVVPLLKKKFLGGGISMFMPGSGLNPAGGSLRLAGQRGKGCCSKGKGIGVAGGGLNPAGGGKKSNPWMTHVKKVKNANKGMKFSDVLKLASKSYKTRS